MKNTFAKRLVEDLVENGFFEEEAKKVFKKFKNKGELCDTMLHRWDEPITNYPAGFYNVVWAHCRVFALEYIDASMPRAWFRPMFLSPSEIQEAGACH